MRWKSRRCWRAGAEPAAVKISEHEGVQPAAVKVTERARIVLPVHRLPDPLEGERPGSRGFGSTRKEDRADLSPVRRPRRDRLTGR